MVKIVKDAFLCLVVNTEVVVHLFNVFVIKVMKEFSVKNVSLHKIDFVEKFMFIFIINIFLFFYFIFRIKQFVGKIVIQLMVIVKLLVNAGVVQDMLEKLVETVKCFRVVNMALALIHQNANAFQDGEGFYVNKVLCEISLYFIVLNSQLTISKFITSIIAICSATCSKMTGYCTKPGTCRCKIGWMGENCTQCHPYPGCQNGDCRRPWVISFK